MGTKAKDAPSKLCIDHSLSVQVSYNDKSLIKKKVSPEGLFHWVYVAECKVTLRRASYHWVKKHYPAWCQCYWPVQEPGLFGARQSMHKFICFWSDCRVLVHWPRKVPLLLSSFCNCIAVHRGPQVGTNAGRFEKEGKELRWWQQWLRVVSGRSRRRMVGHKLMEINERKWGGQGKGNKKLEVYRKEGETRKGKKAHSMNILVLSGV